MRSHADSDARFELRSFTRHMGVTMTHVHGLSLAATACVAVTSTTTAVPCPRYGVERVVDSLPDFGDLSFGQFVAMSSSGDYLVGEGEGASWPDSAFLVSRNGDVVQIPHPPGVGGGMAVRDVNDLGVAVGYAGGADKVPWIYENGITKTLPVAEGMSSVRAVAIGNDGSVFGTSYQVPGGWRLHRWGSDGTLTPMAPRSYIGHFPVRVDPLGIVATTELIAGDVPRAIRVVDTATMQLPLPVGADESWLVGSASDGTSVGWVEFSYPDGSHASKPIVWSADAREFTQLPFDSSWRHAGPYDINSNGVAVGVVVNFAENGQVDRAASIWIDQTFYLLDCVFDQPSDFVMFGAPHPFGGTPAIDGAGRIAMSAILFDRRQGYRELPVVLSQIPPVEGDATCDGVVDFFDVVSVTSAWGPCVDCTADLTDDTVVDLDDLLLVLTQWSA